MNSDTIKQLTLGETVDKDATYLVEEWIKMVVNPLKMLRQLHHTIGANKFDIFSKDNNLFAKRNRKLSSDVSIYQLKVESFREYIQAFARLYPDVYDGLEKIRKSIDKKIELENDWFEQIKCKHDDFTVVSKKKTVSEKEISIKMFRCHKCFKQISIAVHNIITDKRLVEELDKLNPPDTKYCHQWTYVAHDDLAFYHFVCPLCERMLRLAAEDNKRLENIRDAVSDRLVSGGKIWMCENIQYFFHTHLNETKTVDDILKINEDFIKTRNINNKDYINVVFRILDILLEYEYIEECNNKGKDPLDRMFIRKRKLVKN
jgi:hypothetical protein